MTSAPFRYDFSLWYCPDDDAIATTISTTLRAHGFRGYVEHQDAAAGQQVVASANETIEASRVAIVLLTARALADPWCQRVVEWNVIRTIHQEGTKVVPVYAGITSREAPFALRHLTGLEYGGPFFTQRLVGSLQRARRRGAPIPCPPSRAGD